jgi:hypothetical protein
MDQQYYQEGIPIQAHAQGDYGYAMPDDQRIGDDQDEFG